MLRRFFRKSKVSVRVVVTALVLAIIMPLYGFAALLMWQLHFDERQALERRTTRMADTFANVVTRQLDDMTLTLRVLATSPELGTRQLAAFHERTQEAMQAGPWHLIYVNDKGEQFLNTRVPFGTPLGQISDMVSLRKALELERTVVSDTFYGKVAEEWVFNVVLPLEQGGALILTQNVINLFRDITTEHLPEQWNAAIIDGEGDVIYATDGSESGRPFQAVPVTAITGGSGIVEEGYLKEEITAGYTKVRGASWRSVVWGPFATASTHLTSVLQNLALGGILVLIASTGLALLLGRYLEQSMVGIAEMASQLGEGKTVSPWLTGLKEADMVAVALTNASFERSQAEDQLRMMVGELSHRTKNLLAVILSLISQTAKEAGDLPSFRAEITERIRGLGKSIDLMTGALWSPIPLETLVTRQIEAFTAAPEQYEIEGDGVNIKADAVANLGMIFHELATNSVKYGAFSVPDGRIHISWETSRGEPGTGEAGEILHLNWRERGGPPASEPQGKGLGSVLLERIPAGFGGSSRIDYTEEGLTWSMRIPLLRVQGAEAAAAAE